MDARKNPLFLGSSMVAFATNISFDDGRISSRPGIMHRPLGVSGQFQGFARYQPARGLSFTPFGPSIDALAIAADERIWVYEFGLKCANELCNPVRYSGTVNLFQAENYLIVQSPNFDTTWYEGGLCFVRSPGIGGPSETVSSCSCEVEALEKELVGGKNYCCYDRIRYTEFKAVPTSEDESSDAGSHDTFVWEKHKNFLINGAGVGAYVHGRIHQEGPQAIYVSDILHGRGNKATDDVLLMEEQVLGSMGPPLSTTSSMGNLIAMAPMPRQGSANGDGDLVAYYENGVVSFDTFQFPRETRHDGEGKQITAGWDTKRMVSSLLNSISAVGRYAVAVLPRDHFFRSKFGLHFLKTSLGEGTFNDETTNTISAPVSPILEEDPVNALTGAATGHWLAGSRMFATVGLRLSEAYTASAMGKGWLSWNQASTFTQDRTPIPVWEGVWTPGTGVAGVHAFAQHGDTYGAICSTSDSRLTFATIHPDLSHDLIDGEITPIEWEIITSSTVLAGMRRMASISGGLIEAKLIAGSKILIEARTDSEPEWQEWMTVEGCTDTESIVSQSLNIPPKGVRTGTWIQFRLTGLGSAEIITLEVNFSEGETKGQGRSSCVVAAPKNEQDFFRLSEDQSYRWK